MSHPDGLPDLFLDRSLGRVKVPQLLRAAGLRLVTLSEHFGIPRDEQVTDVEWLELAGTRGWVVLMKDARIRYNRAERDALRDHGVRCFCLTRQNLTADEMAERFVSALPAMVAACAEAGPFLYAVHAHRIARVTLGSSAP